MEFIFIRLNVLREVSLYMYQTSAIILGPIAFQLCLVSYDIVLCKQYLERQLRMEGLPFGYDFEVGPCNCVSLSCH